MENRSTLIQVEDLVKISKENGIKRFIYASSSSVYGIKSEPNVDETFSLQPLTDYSKFKAMCEEILFKKKIMNLYVRVSDLQQFVDTLEDKGLTL